MLISDWSSDVCSSDLNGSRAVPRASASCGGTRSSRPPCREACSRSPAVFQQPLLVALPVAFLDRFALVMSFLSLGEREFDLRPAPAVVIDRQRHPRHALAPEGAVQLVTLSAVEPHFRPDGRGLGKECFSTWIY